MTVRWFVPVLLSLVAVASGARAAPVRVGEPAPAFQLQDAQGGSHGLAEFRGSVVAVDFWAMWCPVCRRALPALDTLARRYGDAGFRVLAINIDSDRRAAVAFLAQQLPAAGLTVLFDPAGGVMERFGADGMPALFVVDREGVVRMVEVGYAADAIAPLEDRIVALLGAPPATVPAPRLVTPPASAGRPD